MSKFEWGEIGKQLTKNYDLLITFASYEERCLSLVQNIPKEKIKNAVIFYLSDYEKYTSDNLLCLQSILKRNNIINNTVSLCHKKPIVSFDRIVEYLDACFSNGSVHNIIIDTTTFTHELLLVLLMLFKRKYIEANVTFAYSNAKDYDPQDDASRSPDKWLSKGIGEIRSILGYPGDILPARQTHLMIIVGYEYDRALSIISEIEPASLSLGFGKSDSFTTEQDDISNKHYGASEHFKEVVRDSMSFVPEDRVYEFEVSCNDPERASNDIRTHLKEKNKDIEGKNIILFAMNNKPSTLGVGLLALERQDIQLCYAPALVYNFENYSMPGSKCHLFELFGKQ